MKRTVFLLAAVLVLTSGCIRLKTGFYPESYKADFQGWFKGYASYKEMPTWDGTFLKIATQLHYFAAHWEIGDNIVSVLFYYGCNIFPVNF